MNLREEIEKEIETYELSEKTKFYDLSWSEDTDDCDIIYNLNLLAKYIDDATHAGEDEIAYCYVAIFESIRFIAHEQYKIF